MCAIIDANQLSNFVSAFSEHPSPEAVRYTKLAKAVLEGTTRLDFGGTQLFAEYKKRGDALRLFAKLEQAGRVRKHDDKSVDLKQQALKASGRLRSDDPHVLALAAVARSMILCTDDEALMEDFKNISILKPKRHVYRKQEHHHLLKFC